MRLRMDPRIIVEELERLRANIKLSVAIDDIERAIETGRECLKA
jgi:hypothetical protein